MDYEKWEPLYKKIMKDFNFSVENDIKAANILNQLFKNKNISSHINKLKNLKTKNKLFVVMGNMDYFYGNRDTPIYQKLDIVFKNNEKLALGLTHGSQISPRGDLSQLENLAIERKYDILISGHTHKEEIFLTNKGILLLNPGSVTGAWSFVASRVPSFIELDINEVTKEIIVDLVQIDKNSGEIISLKSHYYYENNRIKDSLI